jgi:dCMP deaminase
MLFSNVTIPASVNSTVALNSGSYIHMYQDPNNPDLLLSEEQFKEQVGRELEREYHKQRTEKWDMRFLEMANLVATWSKDPSTKCGAVIVRPDFSVASVGFNGFPRQMPDSNELYDNREEKYSRIVHCEMNALLFCPERVDGYTLYTTGPCCDRCAVHMLQAGIKRFVAYVRPSMLERWGEAFKKTYRYYEECGVTHVEYNAPDLVLS